LGTLDVVISHDIGSFGPRDGAPIEVSPPIADSLRSVAGWSTLLLLLFLRKANRTRQTWLLLLPLFAVYLSAAVVERQLNTYFVFHLHQYFCSTLCELLCFFSVSVAAVLCLADDAWKASWRRVRFLAVLLLLCLVGGLQIALNAWPMPNAWPLSFSEGWVKAYVVMVLVFMIGHGLLTAILRRCVQGVRVGRWYAGFCCALGVVPLLVLLAVEWRRSGSPWVRSTYETLRMTAAYTSVFSLPWFAMFWFGLLAACNSFWRERLSSSFGVAGCRERPLCRSERNREPSALMDIDERDG
jgi:hypothetical protein